MGTQAAVNSSNRRSFSTKQLTWLWLIGIAVVCIVLYRLSLSFGFVYDDHEQIVANPSLRSWTQAVQAWTRQLWGLSRANGSFYRPLFSDWSYLNFQMFGTHAAGWHATAILLHVAACWGVFALGRSLKLGLHAAGVAALIFAVHPAHVEVVSWISASSDAMATAFYLFAFVAFVRARSGGANAVWWAAALLLDAAALGTKEMAVTFPVMVCAYEWLFEREGAIGQRGIRAIRSALPFAVLTLGYLLVRLHVLHAVKPPLGRHLLPMVLMTLPSVLARYIELLVFPVGLNAFYYTPRVTSPGFENFVLPLLVVLGVAALLWWISHRTCDPVIAFAGLWMPLTLAPALYLPALADHNFVRDRYIYLPSVGFALVLAALLRRIPEKATARPYWIRVAAVVVIVLLLGGIAMVQQIYWADDMAIAYRGFELNPDNVMAELFYVTQLNQRGRYQMARTILSHAIAQPPIETASYHDPLFYSLAITELHMGNMPKAMAALDEGEHLDPNRDTVVAKLCRAAFYIANGDYDKASHLYAEITAENPDVYEAVYNYGYTEYLMKRYADAEVQLHRAVALAPESADAHHYLGEVLLRDNRVTEAESELRRAVALDPSSDGVHTALAVALEVEGRPAEAVQEYRAELARHPQNAAAAARIKALTQ